MRPGDTLLEITLKALEPRGVCMEGAQGWGGSPGKGALKGLLVEGSQEETEKRPERPEEGGQAGVWHFSE